MSLLDELLERAAALPLEQQQALADEAVAATAGMKWIPNPGPQYEAYFSEADELFFGGGAGGGKTDLIAGLVLQHRHSRVFRRHFKDFDGVGGFVPRLTEILGTSTGYNTQKHVWKLGEERECELAAFENAKEAEAYQGRPADLYAYDEITHFEEKLFRFLMTWNRSTKKGQRKRVLCTGNPPVTAEGRWVIKYWAPWLDPQFPNPAKPGELRWVTTVNGEDVWLDGPDMVEVDGEMIKPRSRTFIPASLEDNPDLVDDGEYAAQLAGLPEPYRSAFKKGDFNAGLQDDAWQVIPSAWVLKAQQRWEMRRRMNEDDGGIGRMTSLGVDVAQGGPDKTVLAPLHKTTFGQLVREKGIDTKNGADVAGLVMKNVRDGAIINIDCGGGWGNSAFEFLDSNDANVQACIGAAGTTARDRSGKFQFKNKRAEWYWRFREALDPETGDSVALPPDGQLFADLTAVRRKKSEDSTVIQIESKIDIIKRLGRSTDDGDAVVLAWANDDPDLRRERKSRNRKRSPHAQRSPQVQSGYSRAKEKYSRRR